MQFLSMWNDIKIMRNYQNTKAGFSVASFSLHSNLNVDPSSMCKSGAPTISATASVTT